MNSKKTPDKMSSSNFQTRFMSSKKSKNLDEDENKKTDEEVFSKKLQNLIDLIKSDERKRS